MSRASVLVSSTEIPKLLQDSNIKENFIKLTAALMSGISYECVSQLVPVTFLSQQSGSYHFKIRLQLPEADELARGREKITRADGSEHIHFNSRVLLRMCKLEGTKAKMDCFPSNVSVRVNGVFYKRRLDQEGPMDITPHVKLSPDVENLVIVDQPNPVGLFVLTIILVRARSCSSMVKNLVQNRTRPESVTREKIQQYHEVLQSSDVAVTSTEFSLTCPLSRKRFNVPAQGDNCNHLGCFDLHVYLKLNAHKGKWMCPVCNNKVLPPQLIVDGYWKNVLSQLGPEGDITTVYLNSKGEWSPKKIDTNSSGDLEETVKDLETDDEDFVILKKEEDLTE